MLKAELVACQSWESTHSGASQVALGVKDPPANAGDVKRPGFDPWVGKIAPRAWQPTPAFLPGESHGKKGLAGYSPWGHKESDTTEVTKNVCTDKHSGSGPAKRGTPQAFRTDGP